MSTIERLLALTVVLTLLVLDVVVVVVSASSAVPAAEAHAVRELFDAVQAPHDAADVCSWPGVQCADGHVVSLYVEL